MAVTTWAEKLVKAKSQLDELLDTPVEEYDGGSGQASMSARYRKIEELKSLIEYLEGKAAAEAAGVTGCRRTVLGVINRG